MIGAPRLAVCKMLANLLPFFHPSLYTLFLSSLLSHFLLFLSLLPSVLWSFFPSFLPSSLPSLSAVPSQWTLISKMWTKHGLTGTLGSLQNLFLSKNLLKSCLYFNNQSGASLLIKDSSSYESALCLIKHPLLNYFLNLFI